MRGQLFAPFDLGRWMVLGFTAWLALLADSCPGGGITFNPGDLGSGTGWHGSGWSAGDARAALDALFAGVAVGCVVVLVTLALVVAVAVLWVSSRGQMVFLDNVVHGRAEVKAPWSRFGRQGDGLFAWRLAFVVLAVILVVAAAVPGVALTAGLGVSGAGAATLLGVVLLVGAVVLVAVALAYVSMFLTHFVVPLMHRDQVGVLAAWGRFLRLLARRPGPFLLYGLLVAALYLVVGTAVLAVGLVTCCLGLVLVALPYVGTVLLLPVSVTVRAFGPEFLAQFPEAGPGFFPAPPPDPPAAPAPPAADDAAAPGEPPAADR
jgi:hypothetical protein